MASTPSFPDKKYDILYVDPPWPYYGSSDKHAAAGKHYDLMELSELQALPVRDIANDPCVMFMWTTSSQLMNAAKLFESWGFHYRGVAYVWVKTTLDGKIIHGMGVRPSFTKPTTELLLVGSTQRKGRPFMLADEGQPQVVLHARGAHSEKPEVFRTLIEELFYGTTTKMELFARKATPGWDVWGAEAP